MKQIIVACNTLRDEVEAVLQQEQLDTEVVWIPSGLHNVPAELTAKLQEVLDALPPVDHVLLAMAYCGNSVQGLTTRNYSLTVPRMDDCISLLLGRVKTSVEAYKGLYFMTAGWLKGERNILVEYEHALEKYGERRGKMIFQAMLRHYTHVALLDSGCYNTAAAEKEVRHTAEVLGLGYQEVTGDMTLLRQLMTGPWPDSHYLTVAPNTQITPDMLTLIS